jgi:Uma2 family endonuclease
VIEVASWSVRLDRHLKGPLYARAGIPEYWIVDLNGERIEVYREPSPDGYRTVRYVLRGESLSPAFAPEMVIQVDEILGPAPEAED